MKRPSIGPVTVYLLLGAAMLALNFAPGIDLQDLLARLVQVPRWLLLLILLGAPLAGVPLTVPLLALGALCPLPMAFGIVVAVLVLHHLLVFRLRRTRVQARLHAQLMRRGLMPTGGGPRRLADDLLFILAATWIPGLSYIFKVALTALAGIPFRTYFLAGVSSQTLAAAPYLVLGHVAESADVGWIGIGIFALTAGLWWVKRLVSRRIAVTGPDRGAQR